MICLSNNYIAKKNDRQLRKEVQLLLDELAIMKRKYEDILYNLDDDNFSSRIVSEKKDMKTAIEVTAEGIKTKISKEDLDNSLSEYSTTLQTASLIQSTVSREYVTNLIADDYVTNDTLNEYKVTVTSTIDQKADGIYATVEETYETKDDANDAYSSLNSSISSVSIEADKISSRVEKVEDGEFGGYTLFEQTADKFSFIGNVEISGNAVAGGTITGSAFIDSGGTSKICLGADSGSSVGDFHLIRVSGNETETEIFTIYDNLTSVNLNVFDETFLYSSGENTYPLGYWDFSDATVEFGDMTVSGNIVAKFG